MRKTNWEKVFCFWETCIWICCVKSSQLRREYLPWELSLLGDSFQILYVTNRDFLQVNCLHSDQWITQRCYRSNFNNVWASLPCCFLKDPLKLNFSQIDLTMFFVVRNFGNTSAMRVICCFKMFKIETRFQKFRKKSIKSFWF